MVEHQMVSNNVTRILESKKIPHEVFLLPVEKLGAKETADLLNVPLQQVFKTIVLRYFNPGKAILCVIPGDRIVDLKKMAKLLNEKKLFLPTEKEAELITGLQAGGISPLALINKGFKVFLDSTSEAFTEFHISGGQRGLNIKINVRDFVKLTNAKIADLSRSIGDEILAD